MASPFPIRFLLAASLCAGAARAAVLDNPAITASATPYNASFVAANVFDNGTAEYASLGLGAATYVDFDFGAAATVDGFLNVTRNNGADIIGDSRLLFDTDGVEGFHPATDTAVNFTAANTGHTGKGFINRFAPVTARRVRWQVLTSIGTVSNIGSMEMRFLSSAPGTRVHPGVTVVASFTPFNAIYAAANAANGVAGRGTTAGVEYAGAGGGVNTFVDFDLGAEIPVTGFDFFDRIAVADRVTGFDLIFANHPSFADPVAIRSHGNSGFTRSDDFADPVFARYVRFDVTAIGPGVSNAGVGDMTFYTSGDALPSDFSPAANPAAGWVHGTKSTPQSSALEPFDQAQSADATAPCARWHDGSPEPAFAGTAPAAVPSFTGWGGGSTEWEKGGFYHAWRDSFATPLVSRWVAPTSGFHRVHAAWESHTPAGAQASVFVLLNGFTLASGALDGFAGTVVGTGIPSGPIPSFSLPGTGLVLAAGDVLDFVTVPVSSSGNLLLRAAVSRTGAIPEATATVVIREFQADSRDGRRDEDGDEEDWIELYNGTGAPVDLGGWSLSDDANLPRKWVFPPRLLGYGERLLVFASDKDAVKRAGYGPASELHTSFKLSSSGEFLGLFDATGGVAHAFAPLYPAQHSGFAYGLGSNAITGYLAPTPGAPNGPATTQPLFLPVITPASGLFSGSLDAHVQGALPGQMVRYTTNGTEPTAANGLTYSGAAIPVTASTTLRARFLMDGVAGPVADANFVKRGTGVANGINPATFSSSLPLLVIDTALTTTSTAKTAVPARFALIDRAGDPARARLDDPPAFVTRGTIKPRGQSSLGLEKKPYALEFWDGADRARDLPVLGMPEESDWVLYAAYQFDTDMLRNVLAYELYRRMGRWAPRTRFVEVFFNGGGGAEVDGADYHGVYVLMEKIKRGKDRVDIRGIGPLDNSGPDLTGGYLFGHDKFTAAESLETLGGTLSAYAPQSGTAFIVNDPGVTGITTAQKTYLWDSIRAVDAAIAAPTFLHPISGLHYRDLIRQDTFIDHHLVNAFAKNVDGLRISTYLEKDRGGKIGFSSVWDFDRSMDSDTDNRDDNPAVWNPDNDNGISSDFFSVDGKTAEGWFHRLHQDPDYLQEWVDRFDRWRDGPLTAASLNAFLDEQAAQLVVSDNNGTASADSPVARNWQRWPRTARATAVNGANAVTQIYGTATGSELSRHKAWVTARLAFMDTWVLAKPEPAVPPGVVQSGSPLSWTSPDAVAGGTIYHTLDGSDPRAAGDGVSPSASVLAGPISLAASTRVRSRVRRPGISGKHTAWSAPREDYYIVGAQAASPANLALTEIMYHPTDPTPAEIQAGYPDADAFEYLELQNLGTNRVNLWECRFVSGVDFAFRDALRPELVELAPGGTVLVVKNSAAFTLRHGSGPAARVVGEFAGNDNLNNAGETLTLLDRAGAVLVSVAYTDTSPWPASADGQGDSLHLAPGASGAVSNWFSLVGTPGAVPGDSDGDGQSDLFETWAGSQPGLASSFIRFLPGATSNGHFSVTFDAHAGRQYRLHRSTNLAEWVELAPDFTPAADGPQTWSEPSLAPRHYYRLEALPTP